MQSLVKILDEVAILFEAESARAPENVEALIEAELLLGNEAQILFEAAEAVLCNFVRLFSLLVLKGDSSQSVNEGLRSDSRLAFFSTFADELLKTVKNEDSVRRSFVFTGTQRK